jgi:hypothetical protein
LALAACAPADDGPSKAAHYDLFEVKLVSPAAGTVLRPGQQVVYEVNYKGVLANPPEIAALIIGPDGTTVRRLAGLASTQQSATFHDRHGWFVKDEALKKPGHFELRFEASVRATLRGSEPWIAKSEPLYFDLQSSLDGLRIVSPSSPIAYGTPLNIEIAGRDLWDNVTVTLVDGAGTAISDQPAVVTFTDGQSTRTLTWTIKARPIERVGSHEVRLLASYGELRLQSDPFTFNLTHTIDSVIVLLRNADGLLGGARVAETPLPEVKELVVQARGTQLAGHEVTVNGGRPFVATADEVQVTKVPTTGDFASAKGTNSYAFTFRSGGVERSASVVLRRWAIKECFWLASDGRRYASDEEVKQATPVTMRATTWGFPDTRTTLGIFKDRTATFSIKEDDTGRDILFGPGPDSVQKFTADIIGDQTEKGWTTRFDEETDFPLIGGLAAITHAELFFETRIEEEICKSVIIRVPSTKPPRTAR